jgi:hypothetical protein
MKEAIVLAASAAVVLLIVAAAWVLGFRERAKLDRDALARLAASEGLDLKEALVGADGKAGLALVSGDKLLLARVMGLDASARFAPTDAVSIRRVNGALIASIADPGYPPLHIKAADAPSWLKERVA